MSEWVALTLAMAGVVVAVSRCCHCNEKENPASHSGLGAADDAIRQVGRLGRRHAWQPESCMRNIVGGGGCVCRLCTPHLWLVGRNDWWAVVSRDENICRADDPAYGFDNLAPAWG